MGCGSSKEFDPSEHHGVPQFREPPPRRTEVQEKGQMQVCAPQKAYAPPRRPTAPPRYPSIPEKGQPDFCAYMSPEQAQHALDADRRALIYNPPRIFQAGSDAPTSAGDSPPEPHEDEIPRRIGDGAQKKVELGHAPNIKGQRMVFVEVGRRRCSAHGCRQYLNSNDKAIWERTIARHPRALPLCGEHFAENESRRRRMNGPRVQPEPARQRPQTCFRVTMPQPGRP